MWSVIFIDSQSIITLPSTPMIQMASPLKLSIPFKKCYYWVSISQYD